MAVKFSVPANMGVTMGVVAGGLILTCTLRILGFGLLRRRADLSDEHTTVHRVKESTRAVMEVAQYVSISTSAVRRFTSNLSEEDLEQITAPTAFDNTIHFVDGTWKTVQYLLVLDALNFCFWPAEGLEYEQLSLGLKKYIKKYGIGSISGDSLSVTTAATIREMFDWADSVPFEEERARLLREVGTVLMQSYGGRAARLVRQARRSAIRLVDLIAASFPGFRDQTVYRGAQVFLYKRAQIFVADVFGAFQGKGLGRFDDIGELTTFADYRVPVVLEKLGGILHLDPALKKRIMAQELILPGSEEEVEIRAATVQAVEQIRDGIRKEHQGNPCPTAVQLDWWLWQTGENSRASDPPHHKTMTVFY